VISCLQRSFVPAATARDLCHASRRTKATQRGIWPGKWDIVKLDHSGIFQARNARSVSPDGPSHRGLTPVIPSRPGASRLPAKPVPERGEMHLGSAEQVGVDLPRIHCGQPVERLVQFSDMRPFHGLPGLQRCVLADLPLRNGTLHQHARFP
jgi:hypothetical protein